MAGIIFEKMIEVMSKCGAIGKNQSNRTQGFKFRGIDDLYNTMHHLMAEVGVFTTTEILETSTHEITSAKGTKGFRVLNRYRFHFNANDGSSVFSDAMGEAVDYGDKASNKATSIAHKYALLQSFMIPTDDLQDPDKDSHTLKDIKSVPWD